MTGTVSEDVRRLVRSLERAEFAGAPAAMLALLTQLFDDPAVDAQRLSEPALRLLANVEDYENQPLFHEVLRRTIVTDLEWELRLTQLRRTTPPDDHHLPLLVSLAMQAWNNQYVWADDGPFPPFPIREEDGHDARLAPLIKQQIDDPRIEKEIRRDFEGIAVRHDIVSRVARQYEEFPYPRYVTVPRPRPRSLKEYLGDPSIEIPDAPPRVLVAGTGTGQDAWFNAQVFPGCRVVAFDLSARSLAYGARMAREAGIDNIEFLRASIEDTRTWTRRFDFIETFGVLHHTPDIEESWRALLDLL